MKFLKFLLIVFVIFICPPVYAGFINGGGADSAAIVLNTTHRGSDGSDHSLVNSSVQEADFNAQTILRATTDDTPQAMAVAEQTIIGRKTGGNIDDLSPTEVRDILNVDDGADVTGSNAPQAHKASHQDGGGDEISVTGLSGTLADDQHIIDAEAVTAMGVKADGNALNHDRYADSEAKAAAVQSGAITNGVTLAPTHDAVFDVKTTADAAQTSGEVVTLIGSTAPQAHKTSHTDGSDDIQNATTSQKGLLTDTDWDTFNEKQSVPVVYAKTSSATLTATEVSGLNTLHNDGAGGEVIMTWLALVTGQEAVFYVNDAQYLQIKAPAATTIRIGAVTSAANGYIRSNVVGNWVRVKAMPDGLVVMGFGGVWTYDE